MMLRFKWKYLLLLVISIFVLDFFGIFTHIFEKDYVKYFHYPYDGDISSYVSQLKNGENPAVPPINVYDYRFIISIEEKCKGPEKIRLVYIVKSAAANFERRHAIRSTWGYEKRFSDVPIRTVFVVGVVNDTDVLLSLIHERDVYEDIVHVDFLDSYYNNTIKTVSGMKWAVQFCPNASFYFFSDDDMYVSSKNVLRFLRNPVEYPKMLEGSSSTRKWIYTEQLPADVVLYAGYVFYSSPMRHKSSKWYISLEEYPYNMWPPYIAAGSYVLSREALHTIYYTSMYTKHFRFDDIFLALVAKKAGIEPFHSDEFHFYYKKASLEGYKYAIAVHGYSNPNLLIKVWNEMKANGHA